MTSRPFIGLTLDAEEAGGWSNLPWYAIRQNYLAAVAGAGGLPVALPHEPDRVADYLERIDALVVTGGAFDVDPSYYGGGNKHATVITKDRRTAFEFAVTKGALDQNKPVLGICGGQQLLHVVLGGKYLDLGDTTFRLLPEAGGLARRPTIRCRCTCPTSTPSQ